MPPHFDGLWYSEFFAYSPEKPHVRVHFKTEHEARAHILAMATGVKIISPAQLNDELKQTVKALGEHYNHGPED